MLLDSPYEVGRLDVSHLGMWLNLDRARADSDDALVRLLAAATDHDITDEHREYLDGIADPVRRATTTALFTAIAHESRHFHDLLLSPYGAVVMNHHIRAAMTILSSLGSLTAQPAMIVPLTEWTSLLPLFSRLDPDLGLPTAKLDNLIATLDEIERDLRALDRGIHFPDTPLTTTQILEASAAWVQIGLSGRMLGLDGANQLLTLIKEGAARDRYLGALTYMQERLGWLPSGASQLLLLAALCGDGFSAKPDALRSPVDVLVVLTSWLGQQDGFPLPEPTADSDVAAVIGRVHELVNEFFARVCGEDLAGMMTAASDQTVANVAEWERRVADVDLEGFSGRYIQQAINVYRSFSAVSGTLVANFAMNPIWYLVDRYLDVLPALPRPVTYFWSEHGFATTPELQEQFYVQHELVVPHQEGLDKEAVLAPMMADLRARAFDDGSALRLALVIAPRSVNHRIPAPGAFTFHLDDIDVMSWLGYFDAAVPLARLLTEGPSDSLPVGVMTQALQLLGIRGTKIYSRSGLIPAPPPFRSTAPPTT